jgi:hypothetical protein
VLTATPIREHGWHVAVDRRLPTAYVANALRKCSNEINECVEQLRRECCECSVRVTLRASIVFKHEHAYTARVADLLVL